MAAVDQQPAASQLLTDQQGEEGPNEKCLRCCSTVCCWCCYFCQLQQIQTHERGIISRFGRIDPKPLGPGLNRINPYIERLVRVDMRTTSFDIPPQDMITKDSLSIQVNAIVYLAVVDPIKATVNVHNYLRATKLLAASILRNAVGQHTLEDFLENQKTIASAVKEEIDIATDPWGISVSALLIKDVVLPAALTRAMAAEAEAKRDAKAKEIAAQGERDAAAALAEAARVIASEPDAMQLRYLQTLTSISAEQNSTIVFPLPIEMLQSLGKK